MRRTPEPSPLDESILPWLLLVIATVVVAIPATNYLAPWAALGDDASSHTATIGTLASRLLEGRGWWSTDYNLGFPMALYYQPLPHVVSGLFCAALGGAPMAGFTYKFFMALMILVQPWAIYLGMRRAGADRLHAAFAGALAPCIINGLNFGYTSFASLKVGLYTQAWGNVALPLALGELVAMVSGRGRYATAIAACAALAACHMFFAVTIVVPVGLFALAWPLLERHTTPTETASAAPKPDFGQLPGSPPAAAQAAAAASRERNRVSLSKDAPKPLAAAAARGSFRARLLDAATAVLRLFVFGITPHEAVSHAIGPAKAVGRLFVVGFGTGLVLSAWFLPLMRTRAFMGGWPFGNSQHRNGFGFTRVWHEWVSGRLLDGKSWYSETFWAPAWNEEPAAYGILAIPLMTMAAWAGLVIACARLRQRPIYAFALLLFVWSVIGAVGRDDINGLFSDPFFQRISIGGWHPFASVFDLYPLHQSVEIFRYSSLIQFSAMLLSAAGLASLVRFACGYGGGSPTAPISAASLSDRLYERLNVPMLPMGVVASVVLLILPINGGYLQLKTGFRTLAQAAGLDEHLHLELGAQIAELPKDGRLLVGPKTEVRFHYHGGLLSYMGQRPAGQSYGVGLHDSLGFYVLEFMNLQRDNLSPVLMDLYDFRYVVRKPDHALAGLDNNEVIWANETYSLEAIPGEHQAATLMREAGVIEGTPRTVRERIRRWLNGNGPAERTTWILTTTDAHSDDNLVGSPVTVNEADPIPDARPPEGRIIESHAYADELFAVAEVGEPALLVFKMGYHPFWQVTVDGEPAEGLYAFPMYLAVRVPEGLHTVQAVYRWPNSSRLLLLLIPGVLILAFAADRWLQRR